MIQCIHVLSRKFCWSQFYLGVVRNPWVGGLAFAKTPTQYITPLHERMQRTSGMLSQCLHNIVIGTNLPKDHIKASVYCRVILIGQKLLDQLSGMPDTMVLPPLAEWFRLNKDDKTQKI
jgi:hypothetical protein